MNKKEHTKHCQKRIYLEIMFFRLKNKRNRTESFRTSLLSCVTKIISRSHLESYRKQFQKFSKKKGTSIFLKEREGVQMPRTHPVAARL